MNKISSHIAKLLLIFIIPAFSFIQLAGGITRVYAMSIEDERKLGEDFLREVKKKYEFADDYFSTEYINELGNYLGRAVETKPFSFRFYIVRDDSLNAFAAPGGHIFVFTGLIDAMENVDELAAVICHEIGHIRARHLLQRMEQNKKIGIASAAGLLAAILVGGEAGNAIMSTTIAAGVQTQLNYSREDERQADQLGYKYMSESGFDPGALIKALERIHRGELSSGSAPAYLRTHPAGAERIANIESMVSTHEPAPENNTVRRFREKYILLKTLLLAKYQEPQYAEALFNRRLDIDPDSLSANLGLGMVSKEKAEYEFALNHFKKALKEYPNSLLILRNLGETYQLMGQDHESIRIFDKALDIDNNDHGSIYMQAISYQNIKDYERSIRLLERLVRMPPVRDEVFYDLGISYGKTGMLGIAHYYFGIFFSNKNDKKMAQYHFKQAMDNSGNDKDLQRKINRAIEDMNNKKTPERF